jgi:predicted Zn finger-like uncharacterized protein
MPIKATCPTCTKSYMLADAQAGKRVRCKHCDDVFAVPTIAEAPILEPIDEAPPAQAVRGAPPPVPTAPAPDDEVYNFAPSDAPERIPTARPARSQGPVGPGSGSRRREPRPDSGFRAQQAPASPIVPLALLGAGAILTLMLAIGGVIAMSGSSKDKDAPAKPGGQFGQVDPPRDNAPPKDMGPPKDGAPPRDNPVQPRDNPVQPRDNIKLPPPPPPMENFFAEPKDLDQALEFLKSPDTNRKRTTTLWLVRVKVDDGRRADVARALEAMLKDPDFGVVDNATSGLCRWATRDQVPSLITIMQKGDHHGGDAMNALATLKDERGLSPLIARLKVPGQAGFVANALRTWGPSAEKEVIKLMHSPDFGVAPTVQGLLRDFKTPDETLLTQTIADLEAANNATRTSAVQWLMSQNKVNEAKRGDVAKALNTILLSADLNARVNALNLLEKWGTKDNVPAVIRLLPENTLVLYRRQMITFLGKSKDERAIKPLTDLFDTGVGLDKHFAKVALKDFGAAAEPAVKAKLTSVNRMTRREACDMLGEIGTRDCLGDLKRLSTADPDLLVKSAATRAVKKIEDREKK